MLDSKLCSPIIKNKTLFLQRVLKRRKEAEQLLAGKEAYPMKKTNEAYSFYIKLTRNDIRRLLSRLRDSTQENKIEVCVDICNQRKEFTFREFCERLGIEYI